MMLFVRAKASRDKLANRFLAIRFRIVMAGYPCVDRRHLFGGENHRDRRFGCWA